MPLVVRGGGNAGVACGAHPLFLLFCLGLLLEQMGEESGPPPSSHAWPFGNSVHGTSSSSRRLGRVVQRLLLLSQPDWWQGLFGILWSGRCSQWDATYVINSIPEVNRRGDNHPQKELAIFGNRSKRKINNIYGSCYKLVPFATYCLNMTISTKKNSRCCLNMEISKKLKSLKSGDFGAVFFHKNGGAYELH